MNKHYPVRRWSRWELIAALILGVFGMFVSCQPAEAGGCNQFVNGHAVCAQPVVVQEAVIHHAVPVVAKVVDHHAFQHAAPINNIFYGVGQGVAQEAMIARAVKSSMNEYRFNAQLQGTITGSVSGSSGAGSSYTAGGGVGVQPPAVGPPQFNLEQRAVASVSQACAKCHAGGAAQGGFRLEGMQCEQQVAAATRVLNGTMPPGDPLTPEQKQAVAAELLSP